MNVLGICHQNSVFCEADYPHQHCNECHAPRFQWWIIKPNEGHYGTIGMTGPSPSKVQVAKCDWFATNVNWDVLLCAPALSNLMKWVTRQWSSLSTDLQQNCTQWNNRSFGQWNKPQKKVKGLQCVLNYYSRTPFWQISVPILKHATMHLWESKTLRIEHYGIDTKSPLSLLSLNTEQFWSTRCLRFPCSFGSKYETWNDMDDQQQ